MMKFGLRALKLKHPYENKIVLYQPINIVGMSNLILKIMASS